MSKDKKARRAALRHFLMAIPQSAETATLWLGRLVMLAALALTLVVLLVLFGHHRPPPHDTMLAVHGQLGARDLARLADGRHSFDLTYDLVLENRSARPMTISAVETRLLLRDPASPGDAVDLGQAPAATAGAWHQTAAHRDTAAITLNPGQWHRLRAHYRVTAASEQIAALAIGYSVDDGHAPAKPDAHDEEVALGAVVRAHCALGISVTNGAMATPCGR